MAKVIHVNKFIISLIIKIIVIIKTNQDTPDFKKKILNTNPNRSNTLDRFINHEEQFVKNLNFYNPNIYKETDDNLEIAQKTSYKLFNVLKLKENKIAINYIKNNRIKTYDNLNSPDKFSKNKYNIINDYNIF